MRWLRLIGGFMPLKFRWVFSFVLLLSVGAYGNTPFATYPATMSPYEILEDVFNKAAPATLADFPTYEEINSKSKAPLKQLKMAVTKETKREELLVSMSSIFLAEIKVAIPKSATIPGAGPLFPENPATSETLSRTALLYCQDRSVPACDVSSQATLDYLDKAAYSVTTENGDLTVKYSFGETGRDEVVYRKGPSYLVSKITQTRRVDAVRYRRNVYIDEKTVTYNYHWQ
jgi:hypothetical protein